MRRDKSRKRLRVDERGRVTLGALADPGVEYLAVKTTEGPDAGQIILTPYEVPDA